MDIIRIALYGRDFIVHNRQVFYINNELLQFIMKREILLELQNKQNLPKCLISFNLCISNLSFLPPNSSIYLSIIFQQQSYFISYSVCLSDFICQHCFQTAFNSLLSVTNDLRKSLVSLFLRSSDIMILASLRTLFQLSIMQMLYFLRQCQNIDIQV